MRDLQRIALSRQPPSESTTIQSLTNAGVLLKNLQDDMGEISVTDVFIDQNFGGNLAAKLASFAPGDLDHVFFTSGGLEANETAFKIARCYFAALENRTDH